MSLQPDDPASQSVPVDWSGVIEVYERRAWLLKDAEKGRANYDDLHHGVTCNVNPTYHQGRMEVWQRGCDCGAVAAWKREYGPR